ncbi:MAG: hypothetical protein PHX83_02110 [Acidobacteriia bacterium]|nr:hypothetical protein [Terriglobia bacterium]
MHTFEQLYRPPSGVDESLRPLLERLHKRLTFRPVDAPALRSAIIGVLEFLASPSGRTDANCRAVDLFLTQDEAWDGDELPESFVEILADMSGALHDTISASDIAANFESTPEQLLERARRL